MNSSDVHYNRKGMASSRPVDMLKFVRVSYTIQELRPEGLLKITHILVCDNRFYIFC